MAKPNGFYGIYRRKDGGEYIAFNDHGKTFVQTIANSLDRAGSPDVMVADANVGYRWRCFSRWERIKWAVFGDRGRGWDWPLDTERPRQEADRG